jgi:hypothetical protein
LTLNYVRAASFSIDGGAVAVAPNGTNSGVSVIGALSIAGDLAPIARFDLTDNAAVINYTGTSPAPMVRQQILVARGGAGLGATWTGNGITSSAAAAADPESGSVGYAENATMPLGPYTTFRGQAVDSTSLLLVYTRTGDANLDGVVNDDDVTIVGAAYAPGVPQPSWALGDFDYNGFVDDDDVTLLGVFYDPSAPPLNSPAAPGAAVAAVPEPASLILALVAVVGISVLVVSRRGNSKAFSPAASRSCSRGSQRSARYMCAATSDSFPENSLESGRLTRRIRERAGHLLRCCYNARGTHLRTGSRSESVKG